MRGQVITMNDYDWRKRDRTEFLVISNWQAEKRKFDILPIFNKKALLFH